MIEIQWSSKVIIVSNLFNEIARVWDVTTKVVYSFMSSNPASRISFSHNEQWLMNGSE
jgi:hypothetical protein